MSIGWKGKRKMLNTSKRLIEAALQDTPDSPESPGKASMLFCWFFCDDLCGVLYLEHHYEYFDRNGEAAERPPQEFWIQNHRHIPGI